MRAITSTCLALTLLLAAETALACSFDRQTTYVTEVDPGDTTPPGAPQVEVQATRFGKETSCAGWGSLALALAATDDVTPADDLGHVIDVVDEGRVEWLEGSFKEGPLNVERDGTLYLFWDDGDGRSEVDFELDVWTVDRAGNLSERATRVHVQLPAADDEGCSTTSRGAGMPWLLLAAAWLWRRRRASW
jgi:uncharacterized protein (TIGR03382 family)